MKKNSLPYGYKIGIGFIKNIIKGPQTKRGNHCEYIAPTSRSPAICSEYIVKVMTKIIENTPAILNKAIDVGY